MNENIAEVLIEKGYSIYNSNRIGISFTQNPEADSLIKDIDHYPHAFLLACLMDR